MAASGEHGKLDESLQGIHRPYQWSFANTAARVAAGSYVSTDVGKLARQTDDDSLWMLTATTPTWQFVASGQSGWIAADHTWTYASADSPTFTFTISGVDLTAVLTPGTRIKLTQTTVKYFIVTAVSFSTNTTVTIYGGTDYTLVNAAITNPFFSRLKGPAGFPLDPTKWTQTLTDSSQRQQLTPANGTYYNLGSLSIDIPIGIWRVIWQITVNHGKTSATTLNYRVTLSTANNSQSDTEFSVFFQYISSADTQTFYQTHTKQKWLSLGAKTTYYLNMATFVSSSDSVEFRGDLIPTKVECICGYL